MSSQALCDDRLVSGLVCTMVEGHSGEHRGQYIDCYVYWQKKVDYHAQMRAASEALREGTYDEHEVSRVRG